MNSYAVKSALDLLDIEKVEGSEWQVIDDSKLVRYKELNDCSVDPFSQVYLING